MTATHIKLAAVRANEAIRFSVVLPAYNEAKRLPPYLDQVSSYLRENFADQHEMIIVDDGSVDDLQDALTQYAPALSANARIRWIRHNQNRGKGAAIRSGLNAARGEYILVADADGATPITEESSLRRALAAGADLAIGSRFLAADKQRRRSAGRQVVGWAAASIIRLVAGCGVRDTQCGFKMLRQHAASCLVEMTNVDGFAFDVELIRAARRLGYRIVEVPVVWQEISGSKVRLIPAGAQFLADLARLRARRPTRNC
jgi:dolichyl-phosphate beta-glucosyltransferase